MQSPPDPLTWPQLVLEIVKSLGPAAIALIASLAATYITLRHQRKSKRDELNASSSFRARELLFERYEANLTELRANSDMLGKAIAKLQIVIHTTDKMTTEGRAERMEASSAFFSIVYNQALQMPEMIEEMEGNLAAYGLGTKFAREIEFIKTVMVGELSAFKPGDEAGLNKVLETLLKGTSYMISIQTAIVKLKADELFRDYLPSAQLAARSK